MPRGSRDRTLRSLSRGYLRVCVAVLLKSPLTHGRVGTYSPRLVRLDSPHRLEAQDTGFSSRRHEFESRWGRSLLPASSLVSGRAWRAPPVSERLRRLIKAELDPDLERADCLRAMDYCPKDCDGLIAEVELDGQRRL